MFAQIKNRENACALPDGAAGIDLSALVLPVESASICATNCRLGSLGGFLELPEVFRDPPEGARSAVVRQNLKMHGAS